MSNQELTFKLHVHELDIILKCMMQQPYVTVVGVITKMEAQANNQDVFKTLEAPPAPSPAAPAPVAAPHPSAALPMTATPHAPPMPDAGTAVEARDTPA